MPAIRATAPLRKLGCPEGEVGGDGSACFDEVIDGDLSWKRVRILRDFEEICNIELLVSRFIVIIYANATQIRFAE